MTFCAAGRSLGANALALALAFALHTLLLAWAAHRLLAPLPARPSPTLLVDSIELTLAEVESETPVTEATEQQLPLPTPAPQPEAAPYLFDAAGSIPLPEPPPPLVSPHPQSPGLLIPEVAAPLERPLRDNPLPEITLPPAQPAPKRESTPRQAAGATARLDSPKLVTDLSRLVKAYPPDARRNGWEGTVILSLDIAADGSLRAAEIHQSSGHASLDRAALKMIRSARFAGGPGHLLQPIEYKLK